MAVLQVVSGTIEYKIQNRTEPIPLTEIHESEMAASSGKRILKNAVQLYRY